MDEKELLQELFLLKKRAIAKNISNAKSVVHVYQSKKEEILNNMQPYIFDLDERAKAEEKAKKKVPTLKAKVAAASSYLTNLHDLNLEILSCECERDLKFCVKKFETYTDTLASAMYTAHKSGGEGVKGALRVFSNSSLVKDAKKHLKEAKQNLKKTPSQQLGYK